MVMIIFVLQKKAQCKVQCLANFKRGNGDYMGTAGGLNDRSAIPASVTSFLS